MLISLRSRRNAAACTNRLETLSSPTAKQAANEPYWFAKNQEVSKAITQMANPEYKVEFDGKETYVMCNDVKLAVRRDDRWVSIEAGVTVCDIVENGQHGIEIRYSRVTVH